MSRLPLLNDGSREYPGEVGSRVALRIPLDISHESKGVHVRTGIKMCSQSHYGKTPRRWGHEDERTDTVPGPSDHAILEEKGWNKAKPPPPADDASVPEPHAE